MMVLVGRAQPSGIPIYQFPEQIPLSYQINIEPELAKMPYCKSSKLKKKDFEYFTRSIVENRVHQIKEGEVYLDWIEVELYVKRLLNRLLPDTLKTEKEIKVYIRRDPTPNAYSSYDASIYINVGLLADIKSEAALAFVLSHELAHYIGHHQLCNYQLLKENHKNEEKKLKRLVHNNKLLELEADKVAAQIIKEAGFNIEDAYSVFDLIYNSQNLFKKERIDNINSIAHQNNIDTNQNKSSKFEKITQLAKYEKVQLLLNRFEFDNCLVQALQYFVSDSNLHYLPFYIAESARRHLLLNPADINKPVISLDNNEAIISDKKQSIEKSTYKNILDYFYKTHFLKHLPDLVFSKALFHYQLSDTIIAKTLLDTYTNHKASKKFIELAKYFNTGFESPKLNYKKSTTIIKNIQAYNLKEQDKPVLDIHNSIELNEKYNTKLQKILSDKLPKEDIILEQHLLNTDFRETDIYKTMSVAILLAQNIKQYYNLPINKILFLLQPSTFTLMNKEEFQEVTLFKLSTFKKAKSKKFGGIINPLNWAGKVFQSYITGSENYFYTIEQINLNKSTNTIFYSIDTVNYKLNLPHLLNSVYESIKNAEINHEDFVEN